jgi:uncharacterized membrane protein
MKQKTSHFLFQKPEIKDDIINYSSEDKQLKNNITVQIKKEPCSDGMSEKKYNYSAEVNLNGKIYKGCAVIPGEDL